MLFLRKNIRKISNFPKTIISEDQDLIRDAAKQFSKENLIDKALNWDYNSTYSKDVYKQLAELGFAGIYISEDLGGVGLKRKDASIIFEELSYGCVSTSAYLTIHNMCNWFLATYASDELKNKYCPQLSSFELFSSYCLTEPSSGSDAFSMKTKAVEDGDNFILNGTKCFISFGGISDIYIVMAKTNENEVSAFVVEKDSEGLSFGKNEIKMGWKSQPTCNVIFDNVKVSKNNLIGKRGEGFKYALSALNGGRINIASCSLGGARFCIDKAIEYVKERKQFNKNLSNFQSIQFKISDVSTKLLSSQLIVKHACDIIDNQNSTTEEKMVASSMCKKYATDECFYIADDCLQLFGGMGYMWETGIERVVRDLRVHRILEGTNEIMSLIISKNLLK